MSTFQDKVFIITGGAVGLGFATAKELAARGANLVIVDYDEENLNKAKLELKKIFPELHIKNVVADVSQESAVKNYADIAVATFGRIDGLFNNAGIEGKQANTVDYDVEIFKKVIDINLMGVYYGMRYVIPIMQKQQYGRIVNVASVGGIRGMPNQSAYIASKHAVSGMTKTAAAEFGSYGITINAIAPGGILTPMLEASYYKAFGGNAEKVKSEAAQHNPVKRFGKPEEVAKVSAFLLSEDASYVNGQTIAIDGGQSNIYG